MNATGVENSKKRARSFSAEIFLVLIAFWIGSYSYQQIFLTFELKPLYSYFLIVFFSSLWGFYQFVIRKSKFTLDKGSIWPLYMWVFLYTGWVLFTYFYSSQSFIADKALIGILESSALLVCFMMLVNHPFRVHTLSVVFAILAVFGAGMCIWDFISPVYSSVSGRGAGFYVNPTIAGHVIALFMVGGILAIPKRVQFIFVVFCGVGVLVTFSRAAWLSWFIAFIPLTCLRTSGSVYLRILMASFLVVIVSLTLLFLVTGETEDIVKQLGVQKYMTENTLRRLDISGSSLNDSSSNARKDVVIFSMERIIESPILGYGVGYVREWDMEIAPHNMYLQQWVEGGMVQFLLYIGLLLLMWNMSFYLGKIMVFQVFVNSFFTHNNLDQPVILLIFAFIIGTRLIPIKPMRKKTRTFAALDYFFAQQ